MPGTFFVPVPYFFFFLRETTVRLLRFLCEQGELAAKGPDYLAPTRCQGSSSRVGVACRDVEMGVVAVVGSAIKVVALDCSFIDFFTRVDFYGFLLPG